MSVDFFELDVEDLRKHLLKLKLTGVIDGGINSFRLRTDDLFIVVSGNDFLVLRRLCDDEDCYIRLETSNKDLQLRKGMYGRKRDESTKLFKTIKEGYLETDRFSKMEFYELNDDYSTIEYNGMIFGFHSLDTNLNDVEKPDGFIQYEAEIWYESIGTNNSLKFLYGVDKNTVRQFDTWETYGLWINYEDKVGLSIPDNICLSNEPILSNNLGMPLPISSISGVEPPVGMPQSSMNLLEFICKYIPYAGIQIIKGDDIIVTIQEDYGNRDKMSILTNSGIDSASLFNSTKFTIGCSGKYINIFIEE